MNFAKAFQPTDFDSARYVTPAPAPKLMDIVWLLMVRASFRGAKYSKEIVTDNYVSWAQIQFGTDELYLFPDRASMNYFATHKTIAVEHKVLFAYLKSYESMATEEKKKITAVPIYLQGFPEAKPGSNELPPGLRMLVTRVDMDELMIVDPINLAIPEEKI